MSVKNIPPPGKEYLSFQTYGKSARAAQCAKIRVLNKVIDIISRIGSFEQKCVIVKRLLQSE